MVFHHVKVTVLRFRSRSRHGTNENISSYGHHNPNMCALPSIVRKTKVYFYSMVCY